MVENPRYPSKVEHRLIEVLVMAVCATITCAESWDDMALYGCSKLAWLRTFLDLPNGIPSHDTFRRVFMLIDPDTFAVNRRGFPGGHLSWVTRSRLAPRFARSSALLPRPGVRFRSVRADVNIPRANQTSTLSQDRYRAGLVGITKLLRMLAVSLP